MTRRLLPLALAAALAACDSYAFAWDSSTGTVVVGFVWNGTSTTIIVQSADTVSAGEAFAVTVNTLGSSSCVRPERLDVKVQGPVARLVPYDRVAPTGTECTTDLVPHAHTGSVAFESPGRAVLEVYGRTESGDTVVSKVVEVR